MKISHGKVINANRAIAQIYNQQMPMRISLKLFNLRNALKSQAEFNDEKMKSIVSEMGLEPDEKGTVSFTSDEQRNEFIQKMVELNNLEADIQWEPIELQLTDDMKLSMSEIEALSDFITFTE